MSGGDRDQVAAEGEQPAGERVGAANPEAAAVGVAGDFLAQPVRGGRGAGGLRKRTVGDDRVAGAQLPGLAAPGVGAEVEAGGDLVVRGAGPLWFTLALGDPVEAVVLDRGVARGRGRRDTSAG